MSVANFHKNISNGNILNFKLIISFIKVRVFVEACILQFLLHVRILQFTTAEILIITFLKSYVKASVLCQNMND